MTTEYDGGIVQGYLTQFMQLGVKSQQGEDVRDRLSALVDKAFDQLDIWTVGKPANNKAKLIAELKMTASLIAASSPVQAKLLTEAHEAATAKLNGAD